MRRLGFPGGKRFAFSIFDDTDVATLESIRPIYDCLHELGMRTTKSVWGKGHDGPSDYRGSHTLDDGAYADYTRELHRRGFEIGFHGATMESARRSDIESSLATFERVVGSRPTIYAAHGMNRDNLYWGVDRLAFAPTRSFYALLKGEPRGYFQGQDPQSEYFWGDLAQQSLKYVRSFTFAVPDLLALGLPLVYRRKDTPFVRSWFLSSDAENVEEFNALLDTRAQETLESAGGLCIVSTHFGKGFVEKGRLHSETERLLRGLAARDGWFAPVSEILDHYVAEAGCPELSGFRLFSLELAWLRDSLRRRHSARAYKATEVDYLRSAP
ncbi:MAG TPA: hypothetical protein VFY49_05165 [Myxococcota bacterium]|nr:hypothetical protein [Myxococcota bacterium]